MGDEHGSSTIVHTIFEIPHAALRAKTISFPNIRNIKNTSSGKYLGISSGSLVWSTSKTSWKVERVYKKTGVPKYDPEYFSEKSGMTDGEWSTYWTNYLKSFFAKLYGGQASAVTDNNIGQCMYGAIYSSSLYKGKFHTGLDFLKGGTSVVKCPFTGEYLGCDTKYGCVYVYDSGTNCTFVFMHMNIANNTANNIAILSKTAGETITQGTPMGFESNISRYCLCQIIKIDAHQRANHQESYNNQRRSSSKCRNS